MPSAHLKLDCLKKFFYKVWYLLVWSSLFVDTILLVGKSLNVCTVWYTAGQFIYMTIEYGL